MADSHPIRPISPDEFDTFHSVVQQAFYGQPPSERRRAALMGQVEFDRTLAAFDGGTPVGAAGAWSLRFCLPGAMAPVAGVTLVGVLPSHRRRGILSSLMRRQLADVRERGEAIAALWASEAEIYGRFGYGLASWQANFLIERGEGKLRPEVADLVRAATGRAGGGGAGTGGAGGLRLRLAAAAAVQAEMGKVYQSVLPGRPGMFVRDEAWWSRVVRTNDDSPADGEEARGVLAEDDSGPRGYAVYSATMEFDRETFMADGSLHVSELVASDPAAAALLWEDLLNRDLVTKVTASLRPVDDPLVHMLADPRRARRRVGDGLWVRLADVPKALGLRRYSCPVDVVIEVTDAVLAENAGRWRLTAGGSGGSGGEGGPGVAGECAASRAEADLTLDVAALGAAYLGGTRLGELAGAGLVVEHRAGALASLSAALSWDPAPWCPMIF
jgi:predicted acetyltransferase